MLRKKPDLKILLLQIREDASVRIEEAQSFCRYAEISQQQLAVHNVFDHPSFDADILKGFDGLFIGGASEASVLEPQKYPFLDSGNRLIQYCLEQNVPVFASCFGFQMAIIALGGNIHRSESDFEMGTLPITLTPAGEQDPVFKNTPNPFHAVSVHQESATELPKNCIALARTDKCEHSFRVCDKPFWAFQFHPEVDKKTLVQRLGVYQEKYTEDASHYRNVIKSLVETPESNRLVRNFIDYLLDHH